LDFLFACWTEFRIFRAPKKYRRTFWEEEKPP